MIAAICKHLSILSAYLLTDAWQGKQTVAWGVTVFLYAIQPLQITNYAHVRPYGSCTKVPLVLMVEAGDPHRGGVQLLESVCWGCMMYVPLVEGDPPRRGRAG